MPSLAIFFHLGNPRLWDEFRPYLDLVQSLSHPVDIYITYQKQSEVLDEIRHLYPGVILLEALLGCDVGGQMLMTHHAIQKNKHYDYVLKMHTKTDPTWRRELMDSICGSKEQIQKVFDMFESKPNIGMIGSNHWRMKVDRLNSPILDNICSRLKLTCNGNVQYFIAGTIFWFRWSTMESIVKQKNIHLVDEYNKMEPGYLKNEKPTVTHSWERMFGILVHNAAHDVVGITINYQLDIDFYRAYYDDLRQLNNDKLKAHWEKFGRPEGRICNETMLATIVGRELRKIQRGSGNDSNDSKNSIAILVQTTGSEIPITLLNTIKTLYRDGYLIDIYVDIDIISTESRVRCIQMNNIKEIISHLKDFSLHHTATQLHLVDPVFKDINLYKGFELDPTMENKYSWIIATTAELAGYMLNMKSTARKAYLVFYESTTSTDIQIARIAYRSKIDTVIAIGEDLRRKILPYRTDVQCVPVACNIDLYQTLNSNATGICIYLEETSIPYFIYQTLLSIPKNIRIHIFGRPQRVPNILTSISLEGNLSPIKRRDLYKKCMFGISFSTTSIQNITLEMMCSGLSVIEHDSITIREIPSTALVKISLDSNSLINAIMMLIENPDKRQELGRSGHEFCQRPLSYRDILQ